MKRLLLAGSTTLVVIVAVVFSRDASNETASQPDKSLTVKVEDRNPWTHLRMKNDPQDFQFVVVSDRTGGHRAQIFSRAVEQINLLQPEFVLSVGDLIEGYTEDAKKLETEWREFSGFVDKLDMPFFYVAGNHDITNLKMEKLWKDKFGRRYYHFVYKEVLFLMLCSEDPPTKGGSKISKEQIAWVKKTLEENAKVRWTVVSVHKPLWAYYNPDKNGWLEVEKLLNGRKYTVFTGHNHRYRKYVRQGMSYYQLATTGGGSRLRGPRYREFDHVVWVTMKKDGPKLANLMVDGIYREDMSLPASKEPGLARKFQPTHPVTGKVTLDGNPLPDAQIVLYRVDPKDAKKLSRAADGLTRADGTFALTTYRAFDGAAAGEHRVTIVRNVPLFDKAGMPGPNILPKKYASSSTTPLRLTVMKGNNEANFELGSR